eukprot:772125-Pyramimonas_sp.AAC.1
MQLLYPVVEHIICMGGHKRRESMIVMLLSVSHLRGWKPNSEFQGNVQQRLLYAKVVTSGCTVDTLLTIVHLRVHCFFAAASLLLAGHAEPYLWQKLRQKAMQR